MKITGQQVGPVQPVHIGKVKKLETPAATEALPTDQVLLSADASAMEAARKVIASMPDIREDKVAALRAQIAAGTYHPAADDVADQILAEGRLSSLLSK